MAGIAIDADRDKSIVEVARYFEFGHLNGPARDVSERYHDFAQELVDTLRDSNQLLMALSNLLVSKDAAVRAALRDERLAANG